MNEEEDLLHEEDEDLSLSDVEDPIKLPPDEEPSSDLDEKAL